jgi:branched-chain amino acid transport system substrate-binding protein
MERNPDWCRFAGGNVPHLSKIVRRALFVLCLLLAQLALSTLGGFGATSSQAQERAVNVGVLTDMSGPYRDLSGQGSVEAARMAVEDFGGQVLDTTIQVYAGDHRDDVATATAIATEWFEKKRVGVIVDIPHSPTAIAMHRLAFEHKRIDIAVSSGSTDLTGSACTETGFQWAYDTYSNTVPLVRAMVGFRLNSWFFITLDNAFGVSIETEAKTAIVAAGGRVVGDSRHALSAPNFSAQLAAAQDSGARVIALANAGADTVNAVKEAAELGISSRSQALAPLSVWITDVHAIGLDIAKGMTFIDGFYWNADRRHEPGRRASLRDAVSCRRCRTLASIPRSSTIFARFRLWGPTMRSPWPPRCAKRPWTISSPKVAGFERMGG